MIITVAFPTVISDAAVNIETLMDRLAAMNSVQLLALIALTALGVAAGSVLAALRIARLALKNQRSR